MLRALLIDVLATLTLLAFLQAGSTVAWCVFGDFTKLAILFGTASCLAVLATFLAILGALIRDPVVLITHALGSAFFIAVDVFFFVIVVLDTDWPNPAHSDGGGAISNSSSNSNNTTDTASGWTPNSIVGVVCLGLNGIAIVVRALSTPICFRLIVVNRSASDAASALPSPPSPVHMDVVDSPTPPLKCANEERAAEEGWFPPPPPGFYYSLIPIPRMQQPTAELPVAKSPVPALPFAMPPSALATAVTRIDGASLLYVESQI